MRQAHLVVVVLLLVAVGAVPIGCGQGATVRAAAHLTETITFDIFERPTTTVLEDDAGTPLARTKWFFGEYNRDRVTAKEVYDVAKGVTYKIEYDFFGKPANRRFFCLDGSGRFIRKSGKPVMVGPFDGIQLQRAESRSSFNGSFREKVVTTIYPCAQCGARTGIAGCAFVWDATCASAGCSPWP